MMKRKDNLWGKVLIAMAALFTITNLAFAQATPGGTIIRNRASASYTDDPGNPTKYSSTSNEVTTTVSYVAGLEITPDALASGTVTPGSTATYTFAVRNLGNFTDNVRFLASGASVQLTGGTGTTAISEAFVDANGNGTFDTGDVDIKTNGADALHSLAQNASVNVVVKVAVDAAAPGGQALLVTLGDTATGGPTFDNQNATNSANEVRTSHPVGIVPVNGDATDHNVEAKGTITITTTSVGAVLNGPSGQPGAVGPGSSTNTDYTNQAVSPTATNTPVVFDNTLRNTGNSADTFQLTAPSVPTGSLVEISLDGGTTWTTVATGGVPGGTVTTGSVASNGDLNYKVRITLPSGVTALTASDTTIRATSVNTPASSNSTIDRIYAGYLQLSKTATVNNATGVGGATDPVPGAEITYVITYTNIATPPAGAGAGNVDLSALSVVITEDGDVSPNNWATTTDHVATPVDSRGSTVSTASSTGGVANSKYTDTVGTLAAGQSGTLTIRRTIKQ
jgi:hypothetical protein